MEKMLFSDKLRAAQTRNHSWLCVGLDPDPATMPPALDIVAFNRAIIDATRDLVCAYKPNLAFYLAHGSAGIDALAQTIAAIPRDIPIILDAKFGDIDSTARGYARFAFAVLGADAVTVNPYLGADSFAPFLAYADRAIFLLAHTSNPGARDLQDAFTESHSFELIPEPLFVRVARMAKNLPGLGDLEGLAEVGLVVGATFPEQLAKVRAVNPGAIFLVPGIGAQGGRLADAVAHGVNHAGIGPLINASRAILYAAHGDAYADAARAAALKLRDEINLVRKT